MPKLNYFTDNEFRGQKDKIDPKLLYLIDAFRHHWGVAVIVSPHPKAIGREDGTSQHNWKRYGVIKAIDVFPQGITDEIEAKEAMLCAEDIGFTGIGIYPHWSLKSKQMCGMHLDVRDGHPSKPAKWGGVRQEGKQVYVAIEDALAEMRTDNHFGI